MSRTISRDELGAALDVLLTPERFDDYAPNGLQVEGRQTVGSVVTAVSANLATIEAAIEAGADALVVHHGFFWRSEPRTVVGLRARRIGRVLEAGLSLFGYHLPLDAHSEVGNNACLVRALDGVSRGGFPVGGGLVAPVAELRAAVDAEALVARLHAACEREPLLLRGDGRLIRSVAVCTGGAAGAFEAAVAAGADAYVTGEPSEPAAALARETGVAFVAAGHHATERFGPRALSDWLERELGLASRFVDVENPV